MFWGNINQSQKRVLFSGPRIVPIVGFFGVPCEAFGRPPFPFPVCQVKAFWRTVAYISKKYAHQQILWINFDETSVRCTPPGLPGCVVDGTCWKPQAPHMRVRKDWRKVSWTYGALICNDATIQPHLPHFLFCSQKRLPQKMAKAFDALPPTKLRLLRGKSAWATVDSMIQIVASLRKALQPWIPKVKPILLLDTASPHLPKRFMSFARKQGFQLLFVPASATGLVQPLDVYSFSSFKLYLRRKYMEQRQTALEGQPELLAWLWQLGQAPREFFCSVKWADAFEGVGCGCQVTKLHSALKDFMGTPLLFPCPAKPSAADMALIWPKRRKMEHAAASLF